MKVVFRSCCVPFFFVSLFVMILVPSFAEEVNFESPPVHPVELSPNGLQLYVAHTADHRLVVFDLSGSQPRRVQEIMVGLEPVSVRARTDQEVWVINHISDSISIVNVSSGHVVRTLLVGDEPTDVVFAAGKAFVSVSQEDLVRVYNLSKLTAPPIDISLEASDPRSLALSPDGSTVYVTVLDSQNQTTAIPENLVTAFGGPPPANPPKNPALPEPPNTGLIVRHNGTAWVDESGGSWNTVVNYTMPDNDVIAINTTSLQITKTFHGVGTTLFNVAVNPQNGELYVTNIEAFNHLRFEPNLKGRFAENRMTRINPVNGSVVTHDLNTHVDFAVPEGSPGERAMSLSTPLDVAIDSVGTHIYIAAFGSRKVGVFNTSGNVIRRINVGEGPAGLALDENRNRLYVVNRFASSLSVVNLSNDSAVELPLGFDPSPLAVRNGRQFLYDGEISSAHGTLSCGSCHIFGGMDNIAWDLGDPTANSMIPLPPGQLPNLPPFHPMKGPMTTQSFKGLQGTEPLHWRGDRAQFSDFNPAFVSLMGRTTPLSAANFQRFEDFVFTLQYPGNPFRQLDGSLPTALIGADPVHGEQLFNTGQLVGANNCVDCHALPTGENGIIIQGSALGEDEAKVVPQLRNMYEKTRFNNEAASTVRGFGFTHDGAIDDLFSFLQFPQFTFANNNDRRDVEAFLLAFDTGTHAAVGAQLTAESGSTPAQQARLNILESQANSNAIGLVAKGRIGNQARGWAYIGNGLYRADKLAEADIKRAELLKLATPGKEITFTAVVEGAELRLGIDRDQDGTRDGDELDAGTDPGNPNSIPAVRAK